MGFGLVVVGDVMYLVGGYRVGRFDHSELSNSFLGFDLRRRRWLDNLPALNCARKSCACFYDGREAIQWAFWDLISIPVQCSMKDTVPWTTELACKVL